MRFWYNVAMSACKRALFSGRGLALLTIVGFALWGFSSLFVRLSGIFQDPYEDMSFGWIVPVFSLYVLWTERRELRESVGRPSLVGLLLTLPCAALALLGTRGLQVRFEQVGFIGLCVTVPWALFGRRTAGRCFFPAVYLAFTIPLASFLDVVTIHLRLLASGTALAVLKGFGVEVIQQGTAIYTQGAHPFSIDVAEPCSGLRSIFALMTLTAAYAWFNQPTWPRRLALFACSVPLAVLGNVVRILSICLVGTWADPKFAMGFYHDYSGYIVFIVAISLMVACGEVITRIAKRLGRGRGDGKAQAEPDGRAEGSPPQEGGACSPVVPWLAAAVLCPIFAFQAMTQESALADVPDFALPAALEGYAVDEVRYCQNEQCAAMSPLSRMESKAACPVCGGEVAGCSIGERRILPDDTIIRKRLYRTPEGAEFLVSAVIGGRSKSSIHRPELCMPAQGFLMQNPVNFVISPSGRPFHAITLGRAGMAPRVLAYTFFNQEGFRTASHTRRILADTWDRSVLNRIDRWVMLSVVAAGPNGFPYASAYCRGLLERFLAELTKGMP